MGLFFSTVALYMSKDQQVETCLDEYHNVLINTEKWVSSVGENTHEVINQKMFTGNIYNYSREESILQKDELQVCKKL